LPAAAPVDCRYIVDHFDLLNWPSLCLELGNKDGLQRSYGNQALILQAWGRLEEALALHKKQEALCLELGDKGGLQRSYGNQALILYWNWGLLAREQRDRNTEREKLAAALVIFTDLKMPRNMTRCERNWKRRQQLKAERAN
jgi:hypothetical protein